jgi:hypothetical protein
MGVAARRQLAGRDVVGAKLEAPAEQAGEHVVIASEALGEVAGRCAGAEQTYVHAVP